MVNVRHLVQNETHVDSTLNVKPSNTKRYVHVLHLSPETEKLNVSEFQILVSQIRAVPTKWTVLMESACWNVWRIHSVLQTRDVKMDNVCWLVDWTTIVSSDTFAWITCAWLVVRSIPIVQHPNLVLLIDVLILVLIHLPVDQTLNVKVSHWISSNLDYFRNVPKMRSLK